jgi:hypothetical protein
MEYIGDESLIGHGMYEYANNRLFYWKNKDFASHVLHPFMYNLKLWNKLNNIIVNGYKDYVNDDLEMYMSSKVKFDEIMGEYGECMRFWKYNVLDLTGYTTRYEAAVKNEHLDDQNKTISQLTGYDGLFYPDAALKFLELYGSGCSEGEGLEDAGKFDLNPLFFDDPASDSFSVSDTNQYMSDKAFIKAIHSVYWQLTDNVKDKKSGDVYESDKFYLNWYSHLNYTREEYQRIAM